jgi:UDP-N-acetylglucosamine transferase subunit ALG13
VIFLTVGHQTPFDRLVKAVDDWAGEHPECEVFAQIGDGKYRPRHLREFSREIDKANAVVAHAGTGTIIQVLLAAKPLLVLPRQARLGETRNDHQIGTARYFAGQGKLLMAETEQDLVEMIEGLGHSFRPATIGEGASPELIARLRDFIAP